MKRLTKRIHAQFDYDQMQQPLPEIFPKSFRNIFLPYFQSDNSGGLPVRVVIAST